MTDALGLSPDSPAANSWLASANSWLQSAFSGFDVPAQGNVQSAQSEIEFQQAHPALVLGTAGAGFAVLGGLPYLPAALPGLFGAGEATETGLTGTALARSLGQAGEEAVGITGPKVSIENSGLGSDTHSGCADRIHLDRGKERGFAKLHSAASGFRHIQPSKRP